MGAVGILGGEPLIQAMLRIGQRAGDIHTQRAKTRRADRDEQGFGGLDAAGKVRETAVDEVGAGK